MEKLKVLLTLIVLGLASPGLLHADGNSEVKVPNETIVLQPKRPAGRPNAPSLIGVECTYYNGLLTLTSNYYEGGFSLCFESYETGAVFSVPSILIGQAAPLALETGEYEITAVGEDGTELIGFMQVY